MGKHMGQGNVGGAGIIWIKLAVLYLMIGVGIGMAMGISQNFTLRPVHAHVNLLGWTTMALAGLIYSVFPSAGASLLAKAHFWLMNIALPIMMSALAYVLVTGDLKVIPVLGAAEIAAALAVICFALNLFLNLRVEPAQSAMEKDMAQRARYA